MQNTSKVVTFLDLCGHEKYLKTTIFGLVGMQPDYAMIIGKILFYFISQLSLLC